MNIEFQPTVFRPAAVEKITTWTPAQLRDMRKRGFDVRDGDGGWLASTAYTLAKLILVRLQRDAGVEFGDAWARAEGEVVRNIVFHAARLPGAIVDDTDTNFLKNNPTEIIGFAVELAGEHWAAHGDYFIFGTKIPAAVYTDLEEAIAEGYRKFGEPSPLITIIDLRLISKVLVERAGPLGTVVKVD